MKKNLHTNQNIPFFEIEAASPDSILAISDKKKAREIASIIAQLPPEEIIIQFGEDILYWTWITYNHDDKSHLLKTLSKKTGISTRTYQKAYLATTYQEEYNDHLNLFTTKKILDTIIHMTDQNLASIDLERILQESTSKRGKLTEEELKKYSLIQITPTGICPTGLDERWGKKEIGEWTYKLYVDACTGFAMTYEGKPIVAISFVPTKENTLLIKQIQTVHPKDQAYLTMKMTRQQKSIDRIMRGGISKILEERRISSIKKISQLAEILGFGSISEYLITEKKEPRYKMQGLPPYLNWRRAAISITETIAKELGIKELGIQGAANNDWVYLTEKGEESHISRKDAARFYDDVAKRLNFTQRENQNWYRNIQ